MSTNPDNRDNQSLITQTRSDICRYYFIPCIVLILLCAGVFVFVGVMSIGDTRLSIGLGILILLGVVLAVLAIIAMVATYREMSRLHNGEKKEYLSKVENLLAKLQELGVNDPKKEEDIKKLLGTENVLNKHSEDINNISDRLTKLEKKTRRFKKVEKLHYWSCINFKRRKLSKQ